jgi:predicted regulator of Ras-like GTPase activity (Roadblock/LC7/MglB family)
VKPPSSPPGPAGWSRENDLSGTSSDASPPSSRGLRVFGPMAPRDTDATAFTAILTDLIERVPGAVAAALVDSEGETVDYAGRGDPFDLRVAAAHLQLVLQGIARSGALGEPRWVVVRGERKSVAASALPDGYALGLLLKPRAAFTISTRALKACTRALAAEAGWTDLERHDGVRQRSWFPVIVETDRRGRPTHVSSPGGAKIMVEVLGAVMGLSVRERGFRVRTAQGAELMLVREPNQRWYADEPI